MLCLPGSNPNFEDLSSIKSYEVHALHARTGENLLHVHTVSLPDAAATVFELASLGLVAWIVPSETELF